MTPRQIRVYVACALCAWVLCAGMFYSDSASVYAGYDCRYWTKAKRRSAGMSIAIGVIYGAGWPVGVPLAFLLTGFAEHGIWRGCEAES